MVAMKEPETARSGVVELLSGKWEWTLFDAQQGSTVVFRNRARCDDEMRNWVPTLDLTRDEAHAAGRDAVRRSWADTGGNRWQLILEPIWAWDLPQDVDRSTATGDEVWLVFASSSKKMRVPVPVDTQLGNLTSDTLSRLLNAENARNWLEERKRSDLEPRPVQQSGSRWGCGDKASY